MDIKGKIEEIAAKIKKDKEFALKFKKDPVKTVKALLGINLPEDQIKSIIDGVKAKISADKAGGFFASIKKFFKK